MLALVRNRNLFVYAVGQTLSNVGSSSLWLAAAIWVSSITGSAGAAGMGMFFFGVSAVANPLLGLLIDRTRRLPLVILANLALVVVVVPLLVVPDEAAVWTVYAVMLVYGALNRVITSAQNALVPVIVPDKLLEDANGILRSLQESIRIIAPLMAAGLFVWKGIGAVVIVDAVSSLLAVGLLLMVKVDEPARGKTENGTRLRSEVLAGARYLVRQPILRPVVGGAVIAGLVIGFGESGMFAVATDGLGKTSAFVGVLGTVQGVGSIAIGLFAGWIGRRMGPVWLTAAGLAGMAVAMLLTAVPSLPLVLIGIVVFGLTLPLAGVGSVTCMQRYAPADLHGRVYSTADMGFTVASTTSIALGAGLIGVIGYQLLYVMSALVLIVGGGLVLTGRKAERAARAEPVAVSET